MKQEKRRILALLLAAMLCVGMLTGCSALDTSLPSIEEQQTTKTRKKTRTASPQKAIEQIYQELGKRIGLVEPTAEQLETVVGLDPEDVKEAYVRYVEGDFGADDVYIILPKEGKTRTERAIGSTCWHSSRSARTAAPVNLPTMMSTTRPRLQKMR